jgi:hypothetical protein
VNCSLLLKYPKLKKAEHDFETDVFSYVLRKFEKNWSKPAGEQLV